MSQGASVRDLPFSAVLKQLFEAPEPFRIAIFSESSLEAVASGALGSWQKPLQSVVTVIGVNVSTWLLCAAKHKEKTGYSTAPRALNGLDIRNLSTECDWRDFI